VAVHETPDQEFRHIRAADEPVRIGPVPRKDYLDIGRGIWAAGVPVIPGSGILPAGEAGLAAACAFADRYGYPVMLKAAAGRGGRGIRRIESGRQMAEQIPMAEREARSAFGDERLYLEKGLVRPRHEVGPPEAEVLLEPFRPDLFEGFIVILYAPVEGSQMRFSGTVDGAGFGHGFLRKETGDQEGSRSEGAHEAEGLHDEGLAEALLHGRLRGPQTQEPL